MKLLHVRIIAMALAAGAVSVAGANHGLRHPTLAAAVEDAHTNLVARFVGPEGLLRDYEGEIPTPADCRDCRPNAMGWWSPIENGPMFTGPYLEAVCVRACKTGSAADRALARKLAGGLMRAASVSDVKGMVVRGFGTDGVCHYPLGSEDQTIPWFYGLYAYWRSGLPSADEKKAVAEKVREVAEALAANNWKCPCDGAFAGETRGSFMDNGLVFRGASHSLFLLRAVWEMTGDDVWLKRYEAALGKRQKATSLTMLEVCREGWATDVGKFPADGSGMWIYVCAQGCLARLAEMDLANAGCFREGLARNAARARKAMAGATAFSNRIERPFRYANWRTGYRWRPQKTQKEADEVQNTGDPAILGNRKQYERKTMTLPLSAAAVCAYAGVARDEVEQTLRSYDYSQINLCEFFLAEVAAYSLPLALPDVKAGTVIGHMPYKPGTELAAFKDAAGKKVLQVSFDGDKVFRARFVLSNGKTVFIQRRPAFGDDVSTDTLHFALVWGDGKMPRFFVNAMPFHSSAGIMRGDYPRIDITGNLLPTVVSSNLAACAKFHARPLSNAEVMDDFRRYMPVDLVARDVDHTAAPDMRFSFTVGPDGSYMRPYPAPGRKAAASARVSFTAEVVGHPDTLTRFDDLLVDKPMVLALNDRVSSLPPGPYRVVFRFSTGFSYTIRYNVMSPSPKLPEPSLEPFSRVRTIDEIAFASPAAAPFTNCAPHMAETSAGRYLEADVKSGDRFAWIFRVPAELLGKPCVIDFEWPDDRERVMGLYAYVSGHGMTCRDRISNGIIAGGIFPNSGRAKTHSVMFWPASTNVLLETRTLVAGRPAALLSARLSLLAEPLPVLAVRRPKWTKGRTFGHCDEDQTFDVYMNRDFRGSGTEGIMRDLVAYLKYTGQDMFQYGCGFRYRYGMAARFPYREDCEHHWPVNAGEYPWVTREFAKAGISYSGIIWGGAVPEAENDDLLGYGGERRGWYLTDSKGTHRPRMEALNPASEELVELFFSHFAGLMSDCGANGLSAMRFDINHGSVNDMDSFSSLLAFGAWEGSMWGGRTEEERIAAVTRNMRRFRDIMAERAPSVEPRIGIIATPRMRLDTLRRECGIDLDRLAAIDGLKFAVNRHHSGYWFDLFRGNDETDGMEFYYDAALPEWAAFRKASGGAVAQVAAHNTYIETFEKSLKNDEFPCYFQNADVKPNGRFFLKEPAFCVGTMDVLNFALGDQPLGSSGNEEEVREFVRAYEALPAMPFSDLAGDSPTVVGRSLSTGHGTYFYFVNMHHAPQRVDLPQAVEAEDLSTGERSAVRSVALRGFELRSFLAPGGASIGGFRVARLEGSKADDAARLGFLLSARARLAEAGVDDADGDALLGRAGRHLADYDLPEAHRLLHSVKANAIARQFAAIAEVTEEAALHRRGIWRINCGNTAYSRIDGDLFSPDRKWDGRTHGWYGGRGLSIARDAGGIKEGEKYAALYATEKYRIDGYRVNVGAPGRYRVRVFAKAGWPRTYESGAWLTDYTFRGKPLFPRVDFLRDQPDYWTPVKHEAVIEVGTDGLVDIGISTPSDPTIAFINGLEIERLRQ